MKRRAVVTGMIATYPLGGVAWDYGQYALGLERLGFEVFYLEDTGWMTYDPRVRSYGDDPSFGVRFLGDSLAWLSPSLARKWHFRAMDGTTFGIDPAEMDAALADADVLVNVSNSCVLRDSALRCRCKILIDTDPGWNHFRNFPRLDAHPHWAGGHSYRRHDFFFTYAERIGRPGCRLPTLGLPWQPTRPPVVLDQWRPEPPGMIWTTVMTWRNFNESIVADGVRYGSKEMEFGRVEALPRRVRSSMQIAAAGTDRPPTAEELSDGESPEARWATLGWSVIDAHRVSADAEVYRKYVAQSRAEFSVAKNVYAATASGWFSCRSTCYLAAGRPVVVQDTGFSSLLPTGEGLLSFETLDEAVAAVERVEGDYERHCAAAREVATQHFASDRVLTGMLARAGVC